ncbi:MAG: hypothetical protein AAF628_19900 [Planctomycetota bacterium]
MTVALLGLIAASIAAPPHTEPTPPLYIEGIGFVHSFAAINDTRSHGTVGDAFLSLNEVIQLNKGALLESQLSSAEQAQLFGPPGDVAFGTIDTDVITRITLERDLDDIVETIHGLQIAGLSDKPEPTIDLNGTRGLWADSSWVDFRNMVLENAAVAITVNQDAALFGTTVENVRFRNISQIGIQLNTSTDNEQTRLQVDRCDFLNVPTAVEINDGGQDRRGNLLMVDSSVRGGQRGLVANLGVGGELTVILDRTDIQGADLAIGLLRASAANTRRVSVSGLHLTAIGNTTGLQIDGAAGIADSLTLRMGDLGGSAHGLRAGSPGSALSATIEDGRVAGGIDLTTSTDSGLALRNLRLRQGSMNLGAGSGSIQVADTIFDRVNLATQGGAAVLVDASCLLAGSVQGLPSAPLTVQGSYVNGTTIGTDATVSGSLPAQQLGSMDVSPRPASIGTTVTLQSDLPPGLTGIWLFGFAETIPFIGPPPLHIYFWVSPPIFVTLPVFVRGTDTTPVPIPNNQRLLGSDFVIQMAVIADPGMTAPELSLPPGRLLPLR